MNRIVPAIVSATLCLSLAAETTGRISGKVLSSSGKPVPGATLVLKRTDINWSKTLKISPEGAFMQVGLDPREYDATASAEGFASLTIHVKIPVGETLVQEFKLLTLKEAAYASAAGPAGAPPDKSSVGALAFNQAVEAFNRKDYASALEPIETAYTSFSEAYQQLPAERKPDLEATLFQAERVYGIVLFETGKIDELRTKELWGKAEPRLKAALTRNPKDQRVLEGLFTIAKSNGDAAAAEQYEAAMNALSGPRPELAFNKGIEAFNKGDLAAAKQFFQKALEVDPKYAEAYYWLAMCEFSDNHMKATRADFEKYLELAPTGKHADEIKAMLEDPSLKRVK